MKPKQFLIAFLLCGLMLNLIFPQKAFAYINPGTGSLIFQLIIAFALGGLIFLKMYWQKVTHFFKRIKDS